MIGIVGNFFYVIKKRLFYVVVPIISKNGSLVMFKPAGKYPANKKVTSLILGGFIMIFILQGCKTSPQKTERKELSVARGTSIQTVSSESDFTEVDSPYSTQTQDDQVSSRRFVRNGVYLDRIQISAALFGFDSHKVDARATKMLGTVAEKYHTELSENYVYIVGHTDSDGPELYNSGLSARRAWGVVSALSKYNIPTEKMYVLPAGEYQPIVPNNSKKNKAMNRRVEIYISPDRDQALDWLRATACPQNENCTYTRISILGVNEDYKLSNNLRDPNIPSSVIPMRDDHKRRKSKRDISVRKPTDIKVIIRDMEPVMVVRSPRQLGGDYAVDLDDKRRNHLITTLNSMHSKDSK